MSSHLREGRPRRARRALAAPFVLTAALGGGCFVQADPAPAGQPAGQASQPPAPAGSGAAGGPTQPPTVIANPPPPPREGTPDANLQPAPASGGQVQTHADGTCWWMPEQPPCPTTMACNPPPPRQVQCPAKP